MPLEEIDIPKRHRDDRDFPEPIAKLIEESDKRIDEFFETERNKRYPQFIPSHPEQLYGALDFIRKEGIALGDVFCEWGSGFGVACCLASLMGFEATGIEIESELVGISQDMASDLGIDITIVEGSYIPDGLESFEGVGGSELVTSGLLTGAPSGFAYEGMDTDIEDIDVFFVFPWPGDQDFMLNLFDTLATEGALLLIFYDAGDLSIFRRIEEE